MSGTHTSDSVDRRLLEAGERLTRERGAPGTTAAARIRAQLPTIRVLRGRGLTWEGITAALVEADVLPDRSSKDPTLVHYVCRIVNAAERKGGAPRRNGAPPAEAAPPAVGALEAPLPPHRGRLRTPRAAPPARDPPSPWDRSEPWLEPAPATPALSAAEPAPSGPRDEDALDLDAIQAQINHSLKVRQ